jgi:hypothetical protein
MRREDGRIAAIIPPGRGFNQVDAAQIDHRLPDDAAADHPDRHAGGLSGGLSCLFTFTAVFFRVIIGFVIAHFVHNVPTKGQRKWRGMLLVPWVIPPGSEANEKFRPWTLYGPCII